MRSRGLSLAVTLMALAVIAVLGLGIATVGMQQLGRSRALYLDRKALYAADAGVEAAMRELRRDLAWSAGFPDTALSPEASYSARLTNNFLGMTELQDPSGVRVLPGMGYLVSTGASAGRLRRAACLLRAKYGRFPFAIGAAGPATFGSATVVQGPVKVDGLLDLRASTTVLPERGDGRLLGGSTITTGNSGRLKMDPTQAVRARGDVSPGPPYNAITGTTLIYEGDTTAATNTFVSDGRTTNDAPPGFQALPNPDTSRLLAPGSYVDHGGTTAISGTLDLNGQVHYFPQGVTFGRGASLAGRGTLVIGGGATGEFQCPVGTNFGGHPVNIVALDGAGGTAGGSRLIFREATNIEGLVYSHEDITSLASFRVQGSLFTYRAGAAVLDSSDSVEVVLDDLAVPIKGFEAWMTPPTVAVQSYQYL